MKKNIVLTNGKNVTVNYVEGIVLEQKDWTDQKITSSAAPGYVGKNGIMMGGGTKISSETIFRQKIWLRLESGEDISFDTQNRVVPAREGHTVIMITGHVNQNKPGSFLGAYTYNGDKKIDFMQGGYSRAALLGTGLASVAGIMVRTAFYCGCVATMIGIPLIPVVAYLTYQKQKSLSKELSEKVFGSLPLQGK